MIRWRLDTTLLLNSKLVVCFFLASSLTKLHVTSIAKLEGNQVLRMGSAFSRARCHMSLTASGICSSLRNIGYKELPSSQYHKPQLRMTLNLNHYNYLGNVSDVAWITTPGKRQDTLPGSNAPFHWMPMPASWIRNHPGRRWGIFQPICTTKTSKSSLKLT